MTTIFLVIVGIVLAAAAAIMMFFYGGGAFGTGDAKAQASQLLNLGHNVLAAERTYVVESGGEPASLDDLTVKDGYLAGVSASGMDGAVQTQWSALPLQGGSTATSFTVTGVDQATCAQVNRDLTRSATIPTTVGLPYGCISKDGGYVFYARLSGAPAPAASGTGGTTTPTQPAAPKDGVDGDARPADQPGQWVDCPNGENGYCDFIGTTSVRYGVPGAYITKTATNGQQCGQYAFGSDPAYGQGKSCQYDAGSAYAPQWTSCAQDGQSCSFSGTSTVRYVYLNSYGYQPSQVMKTVTGNIQCNGASFGVQEDANRICQYDAATARAINWTDCAGEGGQCVFSGTATVRYGANGQYYYTQATDLINCNSYAGFGGDPARGYGKTCSVDSAKTATPTWRFCVMDGNTCTFSGQAVVRYGYDGVGYSYQKASGSVDCGRGTFGDPASGYYKHCDVMTN